MTQNVYAIHDANDGQLYMFAALETVLAKDAVLAFMEENSSALFGGEFSNSMETKELAMRQVSETDSIESLTVVLSEWDFSFKMIQVK